MQSGASLSELRKRLSTITCSERRFELIENALRPPEPQLLDTCVVQNLDWVDRQIELQGGRVIWDDASLEETRAKVWQCTGRRFNCSRHVVQGVRVSLGISLARMQRCFE